MRWNFGFSIRWATLSARPVIMLSRQVTRAPDSRSHVQMWDPRNPAPPRTTACLPSNSSNCINPPGAKIALQSATLQEGIGASGGSLDPNGSAQDVPQELAGVALPHLGHFLGGSLGDDPAPALSAFGAEVDDVVHCLDHVQVVLDHHHRVPGVDQTLEDDEQFADILEMETRGRLVEDVEGATGGAAPQLRCQLDPLRLTAGEGRGRLPELDVAEPDVVDGLQDAGDPGLVLEELEGCLDGHLQHLGDVVPLPKDLEGLPVVTLPAALLARHVDVGEEVHLDLDRAVALARLAPPAGDVEREAPRLVAPGPRLGGLGEELANEIEHLGVSRRVRARGAPDR